MNQATALFACLAVASFCSCVNYRIHVQVLPPDVYNVKLDDQIDKGKTDHTGAIDFTLINMSKAVSPKISVENGKYNGFAVLDPYAPMIAAKNLDTLIVVKGADGYREYSLWFIVNEAAGKHVRRNYDLSVGRHSNNGNPARISYWIVSNDTNSYSYFGLKRHLDKYFEDNGLSWNLADTGLQKAMCLSAAGASKDSMPLNVLNAALKDTLDYLVLFFGYSVGGSKQPAVANIVGSAVLTTIGILTAPVTGMLFFAGPGKTEVEIT